MTLQVIGFGLSRAGTYSLKSKLEELQLRPCNHMEHVAQNLQTRVPMWNKVFNN